MKIEPGTLVRVTDKDGICWYGFFSLEDREKDTKVRRIKLNACLSDKYASLSADSSGNIPILPHIIQNVKKMEIGTPKIQAVYHQLLIEASEWKGSSLFNFYKNE